MRRLVREQRELHLRARGRRRCRRSCRRQAGIGSRDYKIAQRYVIKLTQAGILSEVTGQARNRVYRAGEILEAIEGPLERNLN